MSTDTLAALQELERLADGAAPPSTDRLEQTDTNIVAGLALAALRELQRRAVPLLAADHPLRTGEPSEAMIQAAQIATGTLLPTNEYWLDMGRAAVALRAALAVLRES